MTRQLELIDTLLSEGRDEFTFEDAKAHLGVSPEATANAPAATDSATTDADASPCSRPTCRRAAIC